MFGGIALPGRKLGCLVLEIYNRVSLFIISNSILIKYQSAYNASSRFITVISQMTELIVQLI